MPRAIALKLQPQSALAIVVRTSGSRVVAEAVVTVPLVDGDSPAAIGQKISAALASDNPGRAAAVVALPRTDLHWANYDLPPAPLDELPSLVLLQAQRDIVLADDGIGFDYVSLEGDAEHPHRILGVGISPGQLDRIRAICTAADLKLQRIVPEPFGWVELSRRIAADSGGAIDEPGALTVFAAMAGRQAAVWAIQNDELRLVRTVWLAAEPSEAEDVAALAGELRRTLLSLAQTAHTPAAQLPCVYVGESAERIAKQLAAALGRPVRSVRLEEMVENQAHDRLASLSGVPPLERAADRSDHVSHAELAPLAALAASAATDRISPVDLLHPHRPPAPPSKRRTYSLAGAAAACLVLALLWGAYRRIAGPREAAAAADAERAALAPVLDRMAEVETQAAAVDDWLNQSGNLLAELDYLGQQLRPKPLSDSAFNSGEDLIITKLTVAGRQITIDAAARTTDALTPIERRLRDGKYRVMRGVVENTSESTPGYAARMSEVLERIEPGDAVGTLVPVATTTEPANSTGDASRTAATEAGAATQTTSGEAPTGTAGTSPESTTAAATNSSSGDAADDAEADEDGEDEPESDDETEAEPAAVPATAPAAEPASSPSASPAAAPTAAPTADPFGAPS